jgi:hypothetical protein
MAEKFPFPRTTGGNPDHNPGSAMPKMPSSGSGSNGADGLRKVPSNQEASSSGPKGGKMPTDGMPGGSPQ